MSNNFFVFLLFDSYYVLAVDVATFYYTQEFFSDYLALTMVFNMRRNFSYTYVHRVYAYEKFQGTVSHKTFKTLIRMFFYSAEAKQPESKKDILKNLNCLLYHSTLKMKKMTQRHLHFKVYRKQVYSWVIKNSKEG